MKPNLDSSSQLGYLARMQVRLDGKEPNVPFFLGAKQRVRDIAKLMGIRTAEIYYTGSLAEVPWSSLPDEFVIKPSFASTSIGVRLLKRSPGGYEDILTSEPVVQDDLVSSLKSVSARYFSGDENQGTFIVEELLRDFDGSCPPKDVRINAFFGEIGMVYYDYHLGDSVSKAAYFDGDFQPFDDVEDRYTVDPRQAARNEVIYEPTPKNAELLLETARRISLAIPCSFIRVDLYDTPKGVYLGEITFTPGAFYYRNLKLMSSKEDARLGRIWGRAVERLARSQTVKSVPW